MSKIWQLLRGKGSGIAYAIITAIFTIVPESAFHCFKICNDWSDTVSILINRLIICVVVVILVNVVVLTYMEIINVR